jgi:DNA polymerase-1
MPPILYLIDGHALAYRAYFALTQGAAASRWQTSAGEPTAGIFGFTSVLLKVLEQDRPDYLAVAFDTGKTFRDDLFPEYKATRAKMPDDLRPQIERIRQVVDAFNIPRVELEGYEADDVLGSLARWAVAHGLGVKILTGDRDLLQLVGERVIVNLPGKTLAEARDYLAEDVLEALGVRPEQVVDYKGLVGDKSDNIPGVAGIGEKTAVSLLQAHGSLEGIYAHLAELPAGVQKKLQEGQEKAYLSRNLATIVTGLDVTLDLEKARPERYDPQAVLELFRQLEFRSLSRRLQELNEKLGVPGAAGKPAQQLSFLEDQPAYGPPAPAQVTAAAAPVPGPTRTIIVDTPQALEALSRRLAAAPRIAFDTETTSTDQMRADLVGISLAVEPGEGYYIPVGHQAPPGAQLALETVLQALRGPLTDPAIEKVGHNLKYDFILLARNGLRATPLRFDTMIAEWLSNPNSRNLGLKSLAWIRLNVQMTEIEELLGKGKSQITMDRVPIEQAAAYAAADADLSLRLAPVLQAELEAGQAVRLFNDLEMPLVSVLAEMEMIGISLDTPYLGEMGAVLSRQMAQLEELVYQAVGEPFNLNSTQQLSQALFDRLGLKPPGGTRRTASGHYSTSADVLEALSGSHPVVDRILEYRELSKLKSTYVDALPLQVNPHTGRVHTSYNQTGSVTGRIASSDPNLQNIPIRSELGRQVRRAFVAAPGNLLLAVDYSQVELRIAAHMSQDEAMLAAFRQQVDIHAATAAAVYGVPLEKVTKEMRRHAKAINFGLIYGMSAFGLTRSSELTLAEAEDFVEAYFRQFPGVKRYLDGIRRQAARQGYVETLLGRRRYFPGLMSPANYAMRNREEREAINAPIQGTAADIIKLAMLRLPGALAQAGLSGRMLLQVHDELVLECPAAELPATARLVQQVMQQAYPLDAPLDTEARFGPNWDTMQPCE